MYKTENKHTNQSNKHKRNIKNIKTYHRHEKDITNRNAVYVKIMSLHIYVRSCNTLYFKLEIKD